LACLRRRIFSKCSRFYHICLSNGKTKSMRCQGVVVEMLTFIKVHNLGMCWQEDREAPEFEKTTRCHANIFEYATHWLRLLCRRDWCRAVSCKLKRIRIKLDIPKRCIFQSVMTLATLLKHVATPLRHINSLNAIDCMRHKGHAADE
jgi:hypothetical protein